MIKYVGDDQLLKIDEKTGYLVFGIHTCDINMFKEKFVDSFPKSDRIKVIFRKYLKYLKYLEKLYQSIIIINKIWINGSYTTEKEDPDDIDIVIRYYMKNFKYEIYSSVYDSFKKEKYNEYIRDKYFCHPFFIPIYPKDDENYKITIKERESWLNFFTTDKNGNRKGFVEIIM
jgi:hypothetical protein